jgi:hypothetical protein
MSRIAQQRETIGQNSANQFHQEKDGSNNQRNGKALPVFMPVL